MLDARPVRGFFRSLRTPVYTALIVWLLALPWLELGGEPLLRLDVPGRRFHVFGQVIFPQELFLLWLIAIGLALTLFLVTALLGRVWCGWACPQTVLSDLFAGVARRIQGWKGTHPPARVTRARVVSTHVAWLGLALVLGFHLVAYFTAPLELLRDLVHADVSRTQLGFLLAATALAYADFGLVRQTFCKYLCPYARFQGVLFDSDTLVVAYDARRGEPRGKRGRARGDCVDCGLCVSACPTGIDIRDGLQLECIACTQCIDACNGVMAKVGRAPNLIGMSSQVALEGVRRARRARPRVLIYAALLAAVAAGFGAALGTRRGFELTVAHQGAQLAERLADGRTANAYALRVENRALEARSYRLALEAPSGFALVAGENPITLEPATRRELRVFVAAPAERPSLPVQAIVFALADVDEPERSIRRRATFVFSSGGPRP
jgi:cytochrome c oxidase accessory protein FixG